MSEMVFWSHPTRTARSIWRQPRRRRRARQIRPTRRSSTHSMVQLSAYHGRICVPKRSPTGRRISSRDGRGRGRGMYLNALEFLEEEREAWRPFEALDGLTDEQL